MEAFWSALAGGVAICQLYGLRGGMSSAPDPESRRQLLTELNKIGALFAASAEVQTHLRRFHSNRSNPNFISLIKAAAAEAGMDISGLSNDDIESVFS